ncbi:MULTISPECIES: HEAT repeat domain-containing protein [unclassified Undibacterium]|uniref:HEAT repeat domain-containing protein n=1 Tax=unclassified Undibacterium TaxID=2630295 RepID=UPI002AC974A6|nr:MULTISPECIES: HEAT repeat domain-containing protein [unclassified Undibacterium]MEB0140154.1 HEAT repeat domain-containing protein [Undibacterium sp. CCC2.1]MEB0172472.1 HEAT repeat domain-containing protein [Undibacterium sp. CCC1.1]MEB0176990.1 HEAT repeat domain-containing protein [Undibacterium sp. CCC3.4]MEB0215594.1 HEAT repeat domain-containing protein [Undibacterium sp. 5I2]WPX43699.1 HEAT repeat domain-containing protein [Undibacterium sp. CCC3.4]
MALIKTTAPAEQPLQARIETRDYPGLLRQLDEHDPAVRRWAARDLLGYPQASASLLARLQVEADRSVREIIFTSLTRLGDAVAVAGMVECLRSDDAQMRNEAIEAMKELPDAVAPIMSSLLSDPDSDVRIMAVNVLESLCHPQVEQWLIDVIEIDPFVNVCGTAVDLLGEVGTDAAHGALERLKQRFAAEPYIQFAADLALKRSAKG